MLDAIQNCNSQIKQQPKKHIDKHNSKKRRRDVGDETGPGSDSETNLKKSRRDGRDREKKERDKRGDNQEKEQKKKKKKKEKQRIEIGKSKGKKVEEGEKVDQTRRKKEKNLKANLQSIAIHDTESQVELTRQSPTDKIGACNNPTSPPLKTILKTPPKRMDDSNIPINNISCNGSKANGNQATLPRPSKPKKSVKFHSEVAAEDGESRQRIHNALMASYKASEAAAVSSQELANILDASTPLRKKQGGKKNKAKKDESAKQGALSYMVEYYKNRETWKFQKAKQNWILRNAFDVNEIEGTGEYAAALGAYIAGLQSKQARDRLLGEANIILKDEKENTKEDGAVDMELRGKRILRAKLVILGLGQEDVHLGCVQSDNGVSLKPGTESDETASDCSDEEDSNGSDDSESVA